MNSSLPIKTGKETSTQGRNDRMILPRNTQIEQGRPGRTSGVGYKQVVSLLKYCGTSLGPTTGRVGRKGSYRVGSEMGSGTQRR